ncbi:hypothetical protein C5749_04440 [Sphingobacterium gobiense]|uniref:Fimbrillin family protein n=2 Tax=Sphingobacterium gobiense TaxID=1382456 RepID=A0A2S9JT67_9SPHI|nr:hypothetical protein C5749_04440 [Sphingobacterium gobiense]
MVSCNKDTMRPFGAGDQIKMRVNVKGGIVADSNKPNNNQRASVGRSKATSSVNQQQTIDLGDGLRLVATLVPQQEAAPVQLKQSGEKGLKALAQPVRNDLPIGTKYRLLVYNATGQEVYRTDEEVTSTSSAYEEFALEVNDPDNPGIFTFIAYSAGTADIPELEGTTLDEFYVTIAEDYDKFMHFVETKTFSGSPDNIYELDVVLWNKLSEITTIVDATNVGLDALRNVSGAYFESASHDVGNRATVKILDGEMTYLGTAVDKSIVFNSNDFPGTAVASQPTVLVHDAASDVTLKLGNLEIFYNGQTFSKSGETTIPVTPGVKYDLYLEIKAWCLKDISDTEFSQESDGGPGSLTSNFTFLTTAGESLVLNIAELDNSFNMVINGTPLATKEIEFQTNTDIDHTARFMSNPRNHGEGTNAQIYNMTGTKTAPVIRVTINTNGSVTMQAKRTQTGSLQTMQLYNGASWNPVIWYTDGRPNEVTVSQYQTGKTIMRFYIDGGVAKVECGEE